MAEIAGTGITEDQILSDLSSAIPAVKNSTLTKVGAEKIGVGQGFASDIYRLKLTWDDDSKDLPPSVVLKVPDGKKLEALFNRLVTPGAPVEGLAELGPNLHRTECTLFRLFLKDPPAFPHPKVFGLRDMGPDLPGYILMEDLSGDMKLVGMAEGLDLGQLEQIFDAFADVSAYTFAHREALEALAQPPDGLLEGLFARSRAGLDAVAASEPALVGHMADWVLPKLTVEYANEARRKIEEELGMAPLLIHGDAHSNNVAWSGDGRRLRALLDWQGARLGCPAEDFAKLLSAFVPADLRRRSTAVLLQRYHGRLCEKLGREPFSLAALDEAVGLCWATHGGAFVGVLPAVQANPGLTAHLGQKARDELVDMIKSRGRAALEDSRPGSTPNDWLAKVAAAQ